MINGNMIGIGSAPLKTLSIVDENNNEYVGIVVGSEVLFTATDNDVREGLVYASYEGVSTGTKNIPSYRTSQGAALIFDGDDFTLDYLTKYDAYDYTQLQCIIAPYSSNPEESVSADKIVLNHNVYLTNSSEPLASVTKDTANKAINFNITNTSGQDYVIHYFTYREEI